MISKRDTDFGRAGGGASARGASGCPVERWSYVSENDVDGYSRSEAAGAVRLPRARIDGCASVSKCTLTTPSERRSSGVSRLRPESGCLREHHRDRRTACESPQRGSEAAARQGGRVQSGSDCVQFLKHPVEVDLKASKLGVQTSGLCSLRLRKHPSLKSEHDNPLLRPIVEVTRDPATRLVGGADDPHARGFQLRPRLHVRKRACDQRGEVRETRLRIRG